jgi:hypothetical protein
MTPIIAFEVRIAGPDDVVSFADELAAHRHANEVNKVYLADLLANPGNEVLCVATVHPADASRARDRREPATGEPGGEATRPNGSPQEAPQEARDDGMEWEPAQSLTRLLRQEAPQAETPALPVVQGIAIEKKHGHTFRSPGRDTWPVDLEGLGKAFASGRPLRKSSRTESCRVCSL